MGFSINSCISDSLEHKVTPRTRWRRIKTDQGNQRTIQQGLKCIKSVVRLPVPEIRQHPNIMVSIKRIMLIGAIHKEVVIGDTFLVGTSIITEDECNHERQNNYDFQFHTMLAPANRFT